MTDRAAIHAEAISFLVAGPNVDDISAASRSASAVNYVHFVDLYTVIVQAAKRQTERSSFAIWARQETITRGNVVQDVVRQE